MIVRALSYQGAIASSPSAIELRIGGTRGNLLQLTDPSGSRVTWVRVLK